MDVIEWLQRKYREARTTLLSGFTLVEMIVAVGIVAIISSLVLSNYRGFDNSVLLTNLAHDVALSVREAQVYGISVRGTGSSFDAGYGITFNTNTPGIYTLFADTNGNNRYNSSDTVIDIYSFDSRYRISRLEEITSGGTDPISGRLNIVFTRPDPEPVFSIGGSIQDMTGVRITLRSQDGSTRTVDVFSTGQISIGNE